MYYEKNERLTPKSGQLFDGYLSNTATQLGVLPDKTNHFIYCILPLAFSDKLVMNCVLALAGAHIGCFDAVDEEAALATSKHYSSALHDLQLALCSEQKAKERNPLQLLLITSLLCKVEVGIPFPLQNPDHVIANTFSGYLREIPRNSAASFTSISPIGSFFTLQVHQARNGR